MGNVVNMWKDRALKAEAALAEIKQREKANCDEYHRMQIAKENAESALVESEQKYAKMFADMTAVEGHLQKKLEKAEDYLATWKRVAEAYQRQMIKARRVLSVEGEDEALAQQAAKKGGE